MEVGLKEVLFIGLAGALGSLGRWGVAEAAKHYIGAGFPWGTMIVNLVGSLLLGMLLESGLHSEIVPAHVRVPVAVGFFGAFTTFSTFSVDTVRLLETGQYAAAAANVGVSVVLGVGGAFIGIAIARYLLDA